jgi:Fe2+ or Zn2+ uptake regulation protein
VLPGYQRVADAARRKAVDEIEALQREIAERFGFRLMGHRLELFGVPLDRPSKDEG